MGKGCDTVYGIARDGGVSARVACGVIVGFAGEISFAELTLVTGGGTLRSVEAQKINV